MSSDEIIVPCFKCKNPLSFAPRQIVSRGDYCPACFQSLKCCRMCQFYDKTRYNECHELMAQKIDDKEKSNFCEYFKIGIALTQGQSEKDNVLQNANALFKDPNS